jgi:hypothetical protein
MLMRSGTLALRGGRVAVCGSKARGIRMGLGRLVIVWSPQHGTEESMTAGALTVPGGRVICLYVTSHGILPTDLPGGLRDRGGMYAARDPR